MTYRVLGVESMAVMCSVAAKIWKEGREEECSQSAENQLQYHLQKEQANTVNPLLAFQYTIKEF